MTVHRQLINKIIFLFFGFILISVSLLHAQTRSVYSTGEEENKPNILWIVSEDNSASYLGAYGNSLATTPNLDHLAEKGMVYDNAFATSPVCAPSRFTLITGMYANVMGTENMRSSFPIPDFVQFFPKYLKKAGYYTTNNSKKDYNTVDQPEAWNESSSDASYKNRKPEQPFFHVKNLHESHESRIHRPIDTLMHDPDKMPIPPYLPSTRRVKRDFAHYYDQITKMDRHAGKILDELKESGEAENTIIFYYSDHGGVLPRSKTFMFESGLHIAFMVYFPDKYKYLAPDKKRTNRLVSFVDFAPTVLSIAGIKPPNYMQGKAFLGKYADEPREYVHAYRGRMDEVIDLTRAVRDEKYLYKRNFMPHRIYGQHQAYVWKAPSMQSWETEYVENNVNNKQRRFFETKPPEELYKISSDPHNVNNLADDPAYSDILQRMRKINLDWMLNNKDLGVIPEELIDQFRQDESLYEAVRNSEKDIPIEEIIKTADKASRANYKDLDRLAIKLDHSNEAVRFWAATGFSIADPNPSEYKSLLLSHINDSSPTVRIAIAEALYRYGGRSKALGVLVQAVEKAKEVYAKVRALNAIQSLHPEELPQSLKKRLKLLSKEYDTGSAPKKYVHRAAKYLLETYSK